MGQALAVFFRIVESIAPVNVSRNNGSGGKWLQSRFLFP